MKRQLESLIEFEFKNVGIWNPFISECGRFSVSPEHYGFEQWSTGGGCMAWIKTLEDGYQIWLTDADNGLATGKESDLIGVFNPYGEQIDCHLLPTEEDIREVLNGNLAGVIARLREPFMDVYHHWSEE